MSDLIHRIEEALEETGKSPRGASLEAGLSARFLTDLFGGAKRSISIENAEKLAPVLDRTPEYLAFGKGPKRPGEGESAEVVDIWDRIPDRWRDNAKKALEAFTEEEKDRA